ncbi:gamma-glutamylcyclotransferase family protein [Aliiglaciecola sp. M165]|uniref:gamma-glutamylcyclotransferase family protein n=1 Tax=Aliiglaciecola sp. M165 TaxID=2593649 RepID=UPI0011806137|nr:gamma-glutamylcyclotransferase family protein [Aliiglaciecola sp. M165]TRY33198.1 gamma-glutamylcyclotransferase [Aliiglaciecola sp. M165]
MIHYFGFGSNMNIASLRAKGVVPLSSRRAKLTGWRLKFNVEHFFRHEGGVGNIEYTGCENDQVLGMLHICDSTALPYLDDAEAYGYGYDRIEVNVSVLDDPQKPSQATTYIGMPAFINNQCLPSQRYLNIVVKGATEAGLDATYIRQLMTHPVHQPQYYPKFTLPAGEHPEFNASMLTSQPLYTALHGCVFDMSDAQPRHEFLKGFFGGRDMTLFHLQRMDTSTQDESLDMIRHGRLNEAQQHYLDAYLHEYAREYRFVGHYNYELD